MAKTNKCYVLTEMYDDGFTNILLISEDLDKLLKSDELIKITKDLDICQLNEGSEALYMWANNFEFPKCTHYYIDEHNLI